MSKTKITEYSTTAGSNTDVGNIQIEGSDDVANFDNALRELMKHIADLNTGDSFIHDTYKIADSDAETRLAKFDAGSITAGQTRTFTFPDKDGTFALTSDISSSYLPLSGGTLTDFLTLHAEPTSDLHAATKKYADDKSAATANIILQSKSTVKSDTLYVSGGSETTVLQIAITPDSAASKFLIMGLVSIGCNNRYTSLRLYRDATLIGVGDADGSRTRVTASSGNDGSTGANFSNHPIPFCFEDSPSTDAEVTYYVKVLNPNSSAFYVNRSWTDGDSAAYLRTISSMNIQEVV